MQKEITFILPTMNRRQYVCRAVDSCLACRSERITPHVLVIDGMSDDGSYELLLEKYGGNPQVRIIRHERVGFQRTAYFGALQVVTEYATFMYDDDVISPWFHQMFEAMLARNKEFVMGYGHGYDVDRVYPFRPVEGLDLFPKYDAALAYFGYREKVRYCNMPMSPICCIVATGHLKEWVRFSREFAQGVPLRQYFMIDRNIGPDIIIYLSSILKEPETVAIAPYVVGQFSEHPVSMSIGYGKLHLQIGYWLGRVWAFEEICRQGNTRVAARCAGYLLLFGGKVLAQMPFTGDRRWFWPFCREILKILRTAASRGFFLSILPGFVASARNRLASRQMTALPD